MKLKQGTALAATLCVFLTSGFAHAGYGKVKSEIEHTTLQYFLDHSNPDTGLVRDAADNFDATPESNTVASMAATGFGLAVVANAATRGLVDKDFAQNYALKVVKFSRDHVPRRKGWFLHWVNWQTGERVWNCEYSTIDTALFMAGALYAAQVFPHGEMASIVRELYQDMDFWDAMTDGGSKPTKRTLSMAYSDGTAPFFNDKGYTTAQWNTYAEQMLLLIMGLGHPTHPLPPETWLAWDRQEPAHPDQRLMGLDRALFVHQYSQLFIDFRKFNDHFPNYHKNSVQISAYHRQLLRAPQKYKTLQSGFWGFSAGEAPDNKYLVFTPVNYSGIVCLGCVAGSAMYMPRQILADAEHWINGPYRAQIWGNYGFTDSIDLDVGKTGWFSSRVLGITVGPEFLSLANINRKTSVWKSFMAIPSIKRGLAVAANVGKSRVAANADKKPYRKSTAKPRT